MGISGTKRSIYPLKIPNFLNFLNCNKPTSTKERVDMEPIEVIEHKGFTVEIHWDQDPESPREWDNLGVMVCKHPRYNLGDVQIGESKKDFPFFPDAQSLINYCQKEDVFALPLVLLDHSGLCMKTGSGFDCDPGGWDTSRVGFIFVTNDRIRKKYSVKRISKEIRARAEACLIAEVKTYSDYLEGSVYGFMVKDKDGEVLDSCWGFYPDHGEPGGSTNFVKQEAIAAAEACYQGGEDQYELPFMNEMEGGDDRVELT
jgi:hypothetical protein